MFAALLGVNYRVISPAQAILPVEMLPLCFWVNMFTMPLWVDDRLILPAQVQATLPAPFVLNLMSVNTSVVQVNGTAVTLAVSECGDYFNGIELKDDTIQRFHNHHCVIMHSLDDHNPLSIFQNFHVSVCRHPTASYNVANYPYFVFHPMQSEFSSFSETFKGYAYHLLQYRLIHVIKFVVCWSNHMCHFMLQNMTMLVNFDLTPQQFCQKLHLTICRSQFYKHDFAVMSSGPGPSINYVVINYTKYLKNIICWMLQHKYLYKISIWFNAKEHSKNQITDCFKPPEHNPSSKIGGGQHGLIRQKIEIEVIHPFVINTLQRSPGNKMCEFVEHIEMSKGLKKY